MRDTLPHPTQIRTFSGMWIEVFDPKPEHILIEDIAHALSNQCRFGGHLPKFYSVAMHSILCAELVPREHKLGALLHDASEAYLLDVPKPIKNRLTNYVEIEDRLMQVIADKFGFEWPLAPEIKKADTEMLSMEWNGLVLERKPFLKKPTHADKTLFMRDFYRYKQFTPVLV